MTALQDWLSIRPPFDPKTHVRSFICALRGVSAADTDDVAAEPALIPRGLERC